MKAVVYHEVGDIRLEDVPDPHIQFPTDAIVRMTSRGVGPRMGYRTHAGRRNKGWRRYKNHQSLSELFRELANEVQQLFRQELHLIRAEVSGKVSRLGRQGAMVVIGGALAYAGLLMLLMAAVLALSLVVETWLAALLVGGAVVALGYGLLHKGLADIKHFSLAPHQTIETIEEHKQWLKEQLR